MTNWTQLEVLDEAGTMVSTDEDPNGNLASLFGELENGLTGSTNGYRHDYVDLTPYAGSTIQLRLRYLTDPAFEERGWFADDFSVTADGATVWTDDVESGPNGWTADNGTLDQHHRQRLARRPPAPFDYEQYYLAEWRNFDGYDNGLKTPYATNWLVNTDEGEEWNVTRTPYNAPGLLIWHRDQSQLDERPGQQPVRPAERRVEGHRPAGRLALQPGPAPRGGRGGQPEPDRQPRGPAAGR